MQTKVNLVITGGKADGLGPWPLGRVFQSAGTERRGLPLDPEWLQADAILFWDGSLGQPSASAISGLLSGPEDVWHSGLCLGTGGHPHILNFVHPTWMFNCDAEPYIDSTSWRVSLRACLARVEVLKKLGFLSPGFLTVEAAALEWGHRLLTRGALLRNTARLLEGCEIPAKSLATLTLPFEDEMRFAHYRFGGKWAFWAAFRAIRCQRIQWSDGIRTWRKVTGSERPALPTPYRPVQFESQGALDGEPSVTVLVPTVDRYPYLRTLLGQLRTQTVKPAEIIVIDQTAEARRQDLSKEFTDLPLRWMVQDQPGQCTSRNAGLQLSSGEYVLFIDDDDEVPPNLIELHLQTLQRFRADVSCGVADEVGAGPIPREFTYFRASDGFPTNNAMIRKDVLQRSGLFDLAYNRAQRADGDLGMRMYLAGAHMVLNPEIRVLHHHAPSGGLRKHKARTVTYAASRSSVFKRALCSASEIYFAHRYFGEIQAREMAVMSTLGTFSVRGNAFRKLAKLGVSLAALPQTLKLLGDRRKQAQEMLSQFPQIPQLRHGEGVPRS